jgi:DNA methylase
MATQAAIYEGLDGDDVVDRELSWSERELPQHERTRHVHALHPYLGKFVPQLVEVFLRRHVVPGQSVVDPFAGSGTTLVEAAVFGAHAAGADVSAFNVLLAGAKARRRDADEVERELLATLARFEAQLERAGPAATADASEFLGRWYAPAALGELLAFRAEIAATETASRELARVVLSRAARSARLTPHYDLDFPKQPQAGPYWCHKHRRECRPVTGSARFLRRYTHDTIRRVRAFQELRADVRVAVHHADARTLDWGDTFDALVTSPPYPGRIDYHEQHRYAFELLELEQWTSSEIGAPAHGLSRAAIAAYVEDMVAVLARARAHLRPGAPVIVVVDDPRGLFPDILERSGIELVERRLRHVNRRTGRREGEFFEQVLVARA